MGRKKAPKIPHPNVLQRLHGWWFFFLLGLGFILLFPWFAITLSHKKMYPAAHFGRKVWGWFLMTLSGLWLKVEFEEKYDPKKNIRGCSQSYFVCRYSRYNLRTAGVYDFYG